MVVKLDVSPQRDVKIVVKERNKTRLVDVESITHLTCDGYLTTIHFIDKDSVTVAKLLKEFELELNEYKFIRANYNTIVNVKYISKFGGSNRKILLVNNLEVFISRRRLHIFNETLNNQR